MLNIARITSRDPAWVAALISIVISIWIIVTDDLINSDGVLYVDAASKILAGDWAGAIKGYNWPFYSLLIALVSKISFLDPEVSAHILNILTQALLAFVFVRCAQLLGANNKTLWFAAILILTNVILNGYRDQIIRDFGYWAFFFTALYFFLKYHESKISKYAIGFSISMIIATLFRIEGIAFLFMAPLLMLFLNKGIKNNLYNAIQMLSPVIVVVIIGGIYLIFSETALESLGRIIDPVVYFKNAYHTLVVGLFEKGKLIEQTILVQGAEGMGTRSMLVILLLMLVLKVISASGYISLYFSFATYLSSSVRGTIKNLNVINGFIFINLLVLSVFIFSNGFLSSRYTMTMGLLISLPAAFGLQHFMESNVNLSVWKKRAKIFVVVMLTYLFLDGMISFGASKYYIKESGLWLAENVAVDTRIIANDRTFYYYAKRDIDNEAISKISLQTKRSKLPLEAKKNYDYLVVEVDYKQTSYEQDLIDWIGKKPIHRTFNKRGDAVVIFKLK